MSLSKLRQIAASGRLPTRDDVRSALAMHVEINTVESALLLKHIAGGVPRPDSAPTPKHSTFKKL